MRVVGHETSCATCSCEGPLDHTCILDEIREGQIVRGNARFPDSSFYALAYSIGYPADFASMMTRRGWNTSQQRCHDAALPDYLSFVGQFCFPAQGISNDDALRGPVLRRGVRMNKHYYRPGEARSSGMIIADARILPLGTSERWERLYHTEVRRVEIAASLGGEVAFDRNDVIATASIIAYRLPTSMRRTYSQKSLFWDIVQKSRPTNQYERELPSQSTFIGRGRITPDGRADHDGTNAGPSPTRRNNSSRRWR